MVAYLLYAGAALYLGVLTSISPCPLATNIAAISYVGRKVGDSRSVMAAGFLYTWDGACSIWAWRCCWQPPRCRFPPCRCSCRSTCTWFSRPSFCCLACSWSGLSPRTSAERRMTEGMQKKDRHDGRVGRIAVGRAVRGVVLPDIGGVVLRPDRADYGFRGRGDHRPAGQDGHQPARGVLARRHACSCRSSTASAPRCRCWWLPSCWPIASSRSARRTTCFPRSSGGRGRSRAGFSFWRGSTSR